MLLFTEGSERLIFIRGETREFTKPPSTSPRKDSNDDIYIYIYLFIYCLCLCAAGLRSYGQYARGSPDYRGIRKTEGDSVVYVTYKKIVPQS